MMNDPVADNPALEVACLAFMQGNWPTGNDETDLEVLRNMEAALAAARGTCCSSPHKQATGHRPSTGLPYGRYLITVDLNGRIVEEETETVARGTCIMDTDKLHYLQQAIMRIIPRQIGRAA